MASLKVRCPNSSPAEALLSGGEGKDATRKHGFCLWTGMATDFVKHLQVCPFECPKKAGAKYPYAAQGVYSLGNADAPLFQALKYPLPQQPVNTAIEKVERHTGPLEGGQGMQPDGVGVGVAPPSPNGRTAAGDESTSWSCSDPPDDLHRPGRMWLPPKADNDGQVTGEDDDVSMAQWGSAHLPSDLFEESMSQLSADGRTPIQAASTGSQ